MGGAAERSSRSIPVNVARKVIVSNVPRGRRSPDGGPGLVHTGRRAEVESPYLGAKGTLTVMTGAPV
ncbi:hypothetical protein D0T12_24995 [Actinomadura spongiicola]|uniref:Uncharacterized protein n=1 Tax=Actinomadura spongiicola TaxID=2303421 RepID=A0A372GBD8_9ACTN|nr:hypothetical protein D0T12_24995 [Actinomadura spongiicola]